MPSEIHKISKKDPFRDDDISVIGHVMAPYKIRSRIPTPLAPTVIDEPEQKERQPEHQTEEHHGGKSLNTGRKLDVDA